MVKLFVHCKAHLFQIYHKTITNLNLWRVLILLWFISCVFLLWGFLFTHINFSLNSDMSSEMVLAQLLANEGKIITKSWWYSTEIRILNTQLVFAPLFGVLSDWQTIRIIGTFILHGIYVASFYYLCKQAGIVKLFPIGAGLLLLPMSDDYFAFVQYGLYYIPHITISFCVLGMIIQYIKSEKKILLWLLAFLSCLAGMGGLRQLLVLYIPLSFTCALMYLRDKDVVCLKLVKGVFVSDFFACLGYLINSRVLAVIYKFQSQEALNWIDISWESFMKVINGFLKVYGYHSMERVFSLATFYNGICFLFVMLLILSIVDEVKNRKKYSFESQILVLYYLCAVVIFVLLYSLTDASYADRYNIPITIFAIPVLLFWLKNANGKERYVCCLLFLLLITISSLCTYKSMDLVDANAEKKLIADILNEEGYKEGYATFWNANVMTELSNGKISMRSWGPHDDKADVIDLNTLYPWLQETKNWDTVPKGKVFIFLSMDEERQYTIVQNLNRDAVIYRSDEYVIYGYSNYDQLCTDINT